PDMRHAIGYALHWPDRGHVPVERLDLAKIGQLSFEAPDPVRFPALRIAADVMAMGGLSGAVFNAAKERALDLFIAGKIGFLDMASVVDATINTMSSRDGLQKAQITLDDVLQADALARIRADEAAKLRG
ncbi:MAG: 1-deoxy-D-xylulose-5-phosphate reductoisomerase, partial [Yoonia sp.]